jgi:phage gp46-like protein
MGAIAGPVITGWMMTSIGPGGFWVFLMIAMLGMALYVLFRMTQRQSVYAEDDDYDAVAYAPVMAGSTAVAVEAAQEYYVENAESDAEDDENAP